MCSLGSLTTEYSWECCVKLTIRMLLFCVTVARKAKYIELFSWIFKEFQSYLGVAGVVFKMTKLYFNHD